MCGIAGALAIEPGRTVDVDRVRDMTHRLAHRGPDGDGHWSDDANRVCLGHRRLSVIDLSTGDQPMRDAETGVVLTFNGEIYNYRELRRDLEREGVRFRTTSDTEVLMRAYILRGPDFVEDLRGMFAFGLWDPRAETLLLARDRIGKKPLYHALVDGVLYFASTYGALLHGAGIRDEADLQQVAGFLTLGYVPAPSTIHPSIGKLQAGTIARVDASGMHVRTYWDPAEPVEPFDGTWDDAVDTLDDLIRTAVDIRLRSDVPLGVFLSGGIDSSLVAAVASRVARTQILTFSMGFGQDGFDEVHHAAAVAQRIGSEHRAFEARFDAIGLIPRLVEHYGEPFGDPSAAPTWVLAENTRQHVTVAVGGDGGDEGFGGYDWYRTAARIRRIRSNIPGGVARFGSAVLASTGATFGSVGRLARASALIAAEEPGRFAALRSFVDPALARRLYAAPLLDAFEADLAALHRTVSTIYRDAGGSDLRRMRVVDMKTYLADCLMPKVDVATMAHGLEARAPLLDHEILRFALALPDEWVSDATTGKRILRAVLDRYLPASLFDRPKQGFDMPLSDWFTRELKPLISRLPESESLIGSGWFRSDGLRQLVDEHLAGRRDHGDRLYNFLILEEWLKVHR
jgi:asparagine synthase (glutamine-hydrolysing)